MSDPDRAKADQKWLHNELRAKRLADYYSRHMDPEALEPMRRNFEVDAGLKDPKAKHRHTQKEVRHDLIRRFVAAYKQTAHPDNLAGDIDPEERQDLKRGMTLKTDLREKWAVRRAAEHFKRDERTIREALNPGRRSRARKR